MSMSKQSQHTPNTNWNLNWILKTVEHVTGRVFPFRRARVWNSRENHFDPFMMRMFFSSPSPMLSIRQWVILHRMRMECDAMKEQVNRLTASHWAAVVVTINWLFVHLSKCVGTDAQLHHSIITLFSDYVHGLAFPEHVYPPHVCVCAPTSSSSMVVE